MLFVRKLIYLGGIYLINKDVFKKYSFLQASQHWDTSKLEQYQLAKLKELLVHAYNNSLYYRNVFKKNNISPSGITNLQELKKIPCLTKEELLGNAEKIQVEKFPGTLVYSETSGSTGTPLVFYRSKEWDAWHRASAYRGYSWHGVHPWEPNGYLWGFNFSFMKQLKTRLLDVLQNRFRLFSYNNDDIYNFACKLKKAHYIRGYSSMIYEVAKKINNNSNLIANNNLKMILGTSEKIFDKYHDEAEKAFGKKIISEYGAAEAGIIAFECPYGNMHINMETVIVEQENNEIIITNLVSNSFPIIRYKLGDYIDVGNNCNCPCGMQHPIIKEVTGRVGSVIIGVKQQYPSLMLYYVFKNLAMEHDIILNYQVVQSQKGQLDVYLEGASLLEANKKIFLNEFAKYFSDDIKIILHETNHIGTGDSKRKDFISKI